MKLIKGDPQRAGQYLAVVVAVGHDLQPVDAYLAIRDFNPDAKEKYQRWTCGGSYYGVSYHAVLPELPA